MFPNKFSLRLNPNWGNFSLSQFIVTFLAFRWGFIHWKYLYSLEMDCANSLFIIKQSAELK